MTDPPLQSQIFWLMRRISALHKLRLRRKTAPLGIFSGQMPLLMYVDQHPGCTQRDIAEALGVSTPSVATSIKRMQKAGMLQKLADEMDIRCNKISLTDKARQVIEAGRQLFDEVCAESLAGIAEQEMRLMERLLRRMEKNLGGEEFPGMDFFEIMGAARQEMSPAAAAGPEKKEEREP